MARSRLKQAVTQDTRPKPPEALGQYREGAGWLKVVPAEGMRDWILDTFVKDGSPLHNEEHRHLEHARFECLWAAGSFPKQGRTVIGLCEEITFRVSGWPRWRQEQQLEEWFGAPIPDFLLTFDASYCAEADEAEYCALIEHEMYHIGQKRDAFGDLEFTKDGEPKLFLRGHDVEEFVGVVRRYGAGHPEGKVAQLVAAANAKPEIGRLQLQHACGTCLLGAA